MKKLITFILVIAILAFAVNYSIPLIRRQITGYAYVDNDVEMWMPDLFKTVFGTETVDKVYYDYIFSPDTVGSYAYAVVSMKMYIGDESYIANGHGKLHTIVLPSGDIFWYGPLDGEIIIDGKAERVTIGFEKLKSSGEVGISLNISKNNSGISFGDNVIKGEVYDYLVNPREN